MTADTDGARSPLTVRWPWIKRMLCKAALSIHAAMIFPPLASMRRRAEVGLEADMVVFLSAVGVSDVPKQDGIDRYSGTNAALKCAAYGAIEVAPLV